MTDPKPTPREIVFAQSALTHLRTRLRDLNELDKPARQALDWLEVVVGAQARTLADEPLPAVPVCKRCNDTHVVDVEDRGRQNCTFCPTPCQKCRKDGIGAYCEHTPCACACHQKNKRPTAEPAQPEADDPIAELKELLCIFEDDIADDDSAGNAQLARYLDALDTLERDRAAHAAEVERLRGELDATKRRLENAESELRLSHEEVERWRVLTAENAALERCHECGGAGCTIEAHGETLWCSACARTGRQLSAARAERPMPSDEDLAWQIAGAFGGVPDDWRWDDLSASGQKYWLTLARAAKAALLGVRRERGAMPTFEEVYGALKGTARRALSDQTRAVFALFGAEPKGQQDSGSPGSGSTDGPHAAEAAPVADDQPDDSSSDERPWNYEAPPESEIGQEHELLPCDGYPAEPRLMTYSLDEDGMKLWTGEHLENGSVVPWSRAFGVTVKAWRRAKPKCQPGPAQGLLDPPINDHKPTLSQPADPLAGMTTPWRERIESLERVVERKSDELAKCDMRLGLTELRCGEIERAVEGLKGGG